MNINFREALSKDLSTLVHLLADDDLGRRREDTTEPLNPRYQSIFKQILSDPNNSLVVADVKSEIVAMLQLTYIPYLTHTGSCRCLIEGVRVKREFRKKGIGKLLFRWAIEQARQRDCSIIQLTTDKARPDAIEFYNSLGFQDSHIGFKMALRTVL